MMHEPTIGTHPQPAGYYVRLFGGTFRTMLDVGMLALGTGLVGLTVAVVLDAFELVSIGLPLTTSSMLGSALVSGVLGAFALGVASEGGYGAPESVRDYPILEVALARLAGTVLVCIGLLTIANRTSDLVVDLALPLRAAHEMVRAVGASGLSIAALIGVPLGFVVRRSLGRSGAELELPAMYVVWMVGLLAMYEMTGA
jgi:hypothetical protein